LSKATPADGPGFASKPDALGVSEALGFAAELFEENAVLFLEVFDGGLLMPIDPARDGNEEKLELSCQAVENLSRVPAAQSSRLSRRSFLVVHHFTPCSGTVTTAVDFAERRI
jgi:hypothetical protein